MLTCDFCAMPMPDTAVFCGNCGTEMLPVAAPAPVEIPAMPPSWLLHVDGAPVSVIGDAIVVGRDPELVDGVPSAVLPIADPGRTCSRSHLLLQTADTVHWYATDLGSANGSALADGTPLEPWVQTLIPGDMPEVVIGGVRLTLVHTLPNYSAGVA